MPYGRASANRAFALAVLASVLLHALFLAFDWPRLKRELPEALVEPLVARLAEPPAPRVEKKPAAKPAAPKPPSAPRLKPAPTPPPRKLTKPAPLAPPTAAPVPAPRENEEKVAASPVPAPAPAPAPLPPPAPSVSQDDLKAQYRAALLDEARRHKRYPPLALDNGWEGDVVVRMSVGEDGAVESLSVAAGSGYAILDRRALEMFRRAAERVPPPSGLRGRSFALDLRAVFRLKEG